MYVNIPPPCKPTLYTINTTTQCQLQNVCIHSFMCTATRKIPLTQIVEAATSEPVDIEGDTMSEAQVRVSVPLQMGLGCITTM